MSVISNHCLSRTTSWVLLCGLLLGFAAPAWALSPSAAPQAPVRGIVAQPEPEAVIRAFILQLAAGQTEQASMTLEPGLEAPRPYSSWSHFFEALRGGQLDRIEPWRKELWSAQGREYRVHYRVGSGRPVIAYVGIRAHGDGPWRVSSWSFVPQPRLSAKDLGRTYAGAGYWLRYPDAYRLRVTDGAVSLLAPGVSDPVIFLSVLPRPENARQMGTEEYVRQFGPLNIESADELVRFERFSLPDGHPAWLETWQGLKGHLGEDRPRALVVGPLYLVPLDPDAQHWLMIRCLPGYESVLDAVARNVTLSRPAAR
ncbi:hypothetical protein J7643_11435 [bacterium]|nr:hypothetical protein [bacterium]